MAGEKQEGEGGTRRSIRVMLTLQQQEALREMGCKGPVDFVEFDPEQLEDRIAPGISLQ